MTTPYTDVIVRMDRDFARHDDAAVETRSYSDYLLFYDRGWRSWTYAKRLTYTEWAEAWRTA